MAENPIDRPDIPPPLEAPFEAPAPREVVFPIPRPVPTPRVGGGLLAWSIYGLLAANLLALWFARDVFVHGWDLFGATFGVLTLHEGSFADALGKFTHAVLNQQNRPVFTGGESFIYGLVPGLLDTAVPWLLWSHFWNLVLFVVASTWIVRRLSYAAPMYWLCVLASPALVSNSIEGLPDLTSAAIPYGVIIAYLLSERREHGYVVWRSILDVLVLALVAAIAFNGYESGKTFFVVPVIAAFTLGGVSIVRRLTWVACALAIAWLVHANEPMTTQTALQAVPHEPAAFARGALAAAREYLLTWYIDCPALGIAALVSLPFLRENRLFWSAFFAAVLGLVTLNAFQFGGAFLIPHRFLILGFTSVLIVSCMLSDRPRRSTAAIVGVLLAIGVGYTSYTTARFVVTKRPESARNWNLEKIYPLPYNRARLDKHIWVDRIEDAKTLVDVVEHGTEPHVVFYGFSAEGEDSVNPQLFVSRVLLSLGYREFTRRVSFFDHASHMYFQFPVKPVAEVRSALIGMRTPFFVHVREPEHSSAALLAKYFNRARVTPVDVGLHTFKSFRVDEFAPPGPIPVQPLRDEARATIARELPGYAEGFCVTTWLQDAGEHSPLKHQDGQLTEHFDRVLREAAGGAPPRYLNVTRKFKTAAGEAFDRSAVAYIVGWIDNPEDHPVRVKLDVVADDEIAMAVNDQSILESLGWRSTTQYSEQILLPPGPSEVKVIYHKYWHNGGVAFAATYDGGRPVVWKCDRDFH